MAKDPAFLFYPGDWLGGTLGMTFEQKGAYMELLMLQFNRGHMTEHMIGQVIGQHWVTLKDKFKQDPSGLWYNIRLEEEKEKRKNFVSSRKNNISGVNQHTPKRKKSGHTTKHTASRMESVNEDEIDNVNNIKKESFDEIFVNAFDDNTCESYKLAFRDIDLSDQLQKFRTKCDNDRAKYYGRDVGGLRSAFQYQLQNLRKNGTSKDKREKGVNSLKENFAKRVIAGNK